MNLSTNIAGIQLEHPIMNAAGTCKTLEEVRELSRSASAAIMVGSITMEPREVNSGNVYWARGIYSLNSLGLPNRGLVYYKETIREMVFCARGAGKPLFVSVAGFSPDEYATLTHVAFGCGADLVELNLGCPNVWEGSAQKRIPCFDKELVRKILTDVGEGVGTDAPIAVKISPFSDPFVLSEIAGVIGTSKVVKAITAVNTFPNAFGYEDKTFRPCITSGNGLAGLGGGAMKPIALGHIVQLKNLLPSRIKLIGTGGIQAGQDIAEFLHSGACAVQIATAYLQNREKIFSSLLSELVEIYEII